MSESNIKLYALAYEHEGEVIVLDDKNLIKGSWADAHHLAIEKMNYYERTGQTFNGIANKVLQIYLIEYTPISIIQRSLNSGGKDDLEINEEHTHVV